MLKTIATAKAPQALGPYSQAIAANGFVFASGQIAIDPTHGQIIDGGIAEQTRQVLNNLQAVLQAAGTDLSKVVKTTVYLKDMEDFVVMNGIYGEFFADTKPARATVEVARLPKDVKVEIDCVALA